MVDYLEVLSNWMEQPHYLLLILIGLYFIAATIDYFIGTFNAIYDKNIQFSSRIAQLGIVRKLVTLAIMVIVVPLALMLPFDLGVYSLTVLYLGIVTSELYSILGHVGIVKDGNKHKNLIGSLFTTFIDNLTKQKGDEK